MDGQGWAERAPRRASKLDLYGPRLLVRDFGKSWRFYRDDLGLTPAKGHGHPPYGEFVQGNRVLFGIFERGVMAKALGLASRRYSRRSVGRSAIIFKTDDVDEFARQLLRRKVGWIHGPTDRPKWGLRTIHLRDPDGCLIEIYSELRKA
jgi:lactoylglutathione lyase